MSWKKLYLSGMLSAGIFFIGVGIHYYKETVLGAWVIIACGVLMFIIARLWYKVLIQHKKC
jgi:hypothetical protein